MFLGNNYALGALLIAGGIFFCFFGNKYVKAAEILAGVLASLFFLFYICFSLINANYGVITFWIVFSLCIVLGGLFGWFLSRIPWLPSILLGGALGFIIGLILYTIALIYIPIDPNFIYWITTLVFIFLGVVFGYYTGKHAIIISTAFIGGYAISQVNF